MADSNTLKVMSIFEAGARLKLSAEVTCLAAHLYHRFFKLEQICKNIHLFDLYNLAAASIKLAMCFYEKQYKGQDVALAMISMIQEPNFYLDPKSHSKLVKTIDLTAKVMTINLDFQVNHKDTRWMTPGLLNQQYRNQHALADQNQKHIVFDEPSSSSSSDDDDDNDDYPISKADQHLSKNDKYSVSSHRYLAHYLIFIKSFLKPQYDRHFMGITNLAWTFLSDFHWSPCVTGISADHLACSTLMMAIEVYRPQFEKSKRNEKKQFWSLINKNWNLILCEDLSEELKQRAIDTIIEQYVEYERVMQHELSTYVIDPLRR